MHCSMQRFLFFLLFALISPAIFVPSSVQGQTARPTIAVASKDRHKQKKSVSKGTVGIKKAPAKKTSGHRAPPKSAVATRKKASKTSANKKSRRQQTARKKRTAAKRVAPSHVRTSPKRPAIPATAAGIGTQISARSVIVMDAACGKSIFEKMADNPRQPASTIKIVTAMIALESLKPGEKVVASRAAANMPSSKINIEPGTSYLVDDLVNAVLLSSANDASVALAEKIAGSEEKFAHLMTLSARMWGAKNTICRTASGLTQVGQQSTARDLANLFRFAMQHKAFAARMHNKYLTTSYGKKLRNHNRALWRIDGAVGGKTGYTVAARQTYVGQFTRNGQSIVVAIMGSESMWADLAKLVEYGFKQVEKEHPAAS